MHVKFQKSENQETTFLKTTNNMKTKIIFLVSNDPIYFDNPSSDVFAYFPEVIEVDRPLGIMCYAHIGQHGICSPAYAKDCRYARSEEFKALYKELVAIGYDDILITYKF